MVETTNSYLVSPCALGIRDTLAIRRRASSSLRARARAAALALSPLRVSPIWQRARDDDRAHAGFREIVAKTRQRWGPA
jgi:hypothetical protein